MECGALHRRRGVGATLLARPEPARRRATVRVLEPLQPLRRSRRRTSASARTRCRSEASHPHYDATRRWISHQNSSSVDEIVSPSRAPHSRLCLFSVFSGMIWSRLDTSRASRRARLAGIDTSAHGDTIEVWKVRREMRRVSPSRPRPSPGPASSRSAGTTASPSTCSQQRRARGRPNPTDWWSSISRNGPHSFTQVRHERGARSRASRGVVGGGRPVHLVCCQVFFGLALWWGAVALLWWNEGDAVRSHAALDEARLAVVSVPDATHDAALRGHLEHVVGVTSA